MPLVQPISKLMALFFYLGSSVRQKRPQTGPGGAMSGGDTCRNWLVMDRQRRKVRGGERSETVGGRQRTIGRGRSLRTASAGEWFSTKASAVRLLAVAVLAPASAGQPLAEAFPLPPAGAVPLTAGLARLLADPVRLPVRRPRRRQFPDRRQELEPWVTRPALGGGLPRRPNEPGSARRFW